MKHDIKPQAYLRYGDDFIVIVKDLEELKIIREQSLQFLLVRLGLIINRQNDVIIKPKWGLKFLGVNIYPTGRKLSKRNWNRMSRRVNFRNYSSYHGLVGTHCGSKNIKKFNWHAEQTLFREKL